MSFLSRVFGRKNEDDDADADLDAALEQVESEDEGLFMKTGPQGASASDQEAPAPAQPATSPNQPPPDEVAPAKSADGAELETEEPLEPVAEATDPQPVEVSAKAEPETTDEAIDDELAAEAADGAVEDDLAAAASAEGEVEVPDAESESDTEEDGDDDDPLAAFRGADKESMAGKLIEGMADVSVQELLQTAREVRDMLPPVVTNGTSEQPSE